MCTPSRCTRISRDDLSLQNLACHLKNRRLYIQSTVFDLCEIEESEFKLSFSIIIF